MNPVSLKVKKGEGIKVLRDAQGYPYPDGEFDVVKTTYVTRAIGRKDLVLVDTKELKETDKNKSKQGGK